MIPLTVLLIESPALRRSETRSLPKPLLVTTNIPLFARAAFFPCDQPLSPLPIIGFAPQKVVLASEERPECVGMTHNIENRRARELPHIWTRHAHAHPGRNGPEGIGDHDAPKSTFDAA